MGVRKAKHGGVLTVIFTILSVIWVCPILIVIMNSFKKKAYINRKPFAFPAGKSFVGIENYLNGIKKINFFQAFGYSLFITLFSVVVIIVCTSMCAWYITRVTNRMTKGIYYLCLFAMIVPFQMVMFTLSKFANMLHLGNPVGIILIYLGFGAGQAVFMFLRFRKGNSA